MVAPPSHSTLFCSATREALDVDYIRRWLRDFAEVLLNPDVITLFEKPWQKVH